MNSIRVLYFYAQLRILYFGFNITTTVSRIVTTSARGAYESIKSIKKYRIHGAVCKKYKNIAPRNSLSLKVKVKGI